MNSGLRAAPALPTSLGAAMGGVVSGVGGMVRDIPYNHLVFKDESRAELVSAALGVLDILLDYQAVGARDVLLNPAPDAGSPVDVADMARAPTAASNSFRYLLAKLVSTLITMNLNFFKPKVWL